MRKKELGMLPNNHRSRLVVERVDGCAVARFCGTEPLDWPSTQEIGEQLDALAHAAGPGALLLDIGNVGGLSGVGLGWLLRLHKRLHEAGVQLVVCNVMPRVREALEVTGLTALFGVRDAQGVEQRSSSGSTEHYLAKLPNAWPCRRQAPGSG
jgi:anti-anti-sigma factor